MTDESDYYEMATARQLGLGAEPSADNYSSMDSGGSGSGLQQAAAADDSDITNVKGAPLVSRSSLDKADQHLQSVIDNIVMQQRSMATRMNPDAGPSRAVQAALASGFGGGSYGTGAAAGLKAAVGPLQHQEDQYNLAQEKMNQLRIQAAQAESIRQRGLVNAQMRGNIYNQKRSDAASLAGRRIDENGNMVVDPSAMDALRQKSEMIEKGRMKAQGLDSLTPDSTSNPSPTIMPSANSAMTHPQAILMAESNNNSNAPNGDGGKAVGPGQLHEAAAQEVGVTDRTDPDQNRAGSEAYLAKYTDVFKDKPNPALWATVAYKDGPGKASKWDGDINSLPTGTQQYIQKVNGFMKHGLLNDEVIPGLEDKIKSAGVNPEIAPRLQAMIEGRGKPLAGYGSNSPYGRGLTALINKIDPTYDEHRYATITDFDTGATSKIIRPINTSIAHLDTLLNYGEALNNGNVQLINKAKNEFSAQFGSVPPSTFDAIKPIVANEVVKAVVARGGGEADRVEAAKALSNAKTPEQLRDVVTAEKALLAGQMNSMEQTYKAGTGGLTNFKTKYLTFATQKALAPKSNEPQFPMTVRNAKGKVATVSSPEELAEAQGDGFK